MRTHIKRFAAACMSAALACTMLTPQLPIQGITAEAAEEKGTMKDGAVSDADAAVIHFDASNTSPLNKTAMGDLYGMSEQNVPSIDLAGAIEPAFMVQKAPNGLQHPTGDGYRMNATLKETGAKFQQIYLQDSYLEWPYDTSNGTGSTDNLHKSLASYNDKVIGILQEMQENTGDSALSDYNFILFNEPDTIWFTGKPEELFSAWETLYKRIKDEVDPDIKLAGPTPTNWSREWVIDFIQYTAEHDCEADVIVWHELYDGTNLSSSASKTNKNNSLLSFRNHYAETMEALDQYYSGTPAICVNEFALFDDMGVGGRLLPWVAMFEETGIYSCQAYWGLANTLNETAADANTPNSAWWLYKWYADMIGDRMTVSGITNGNSDGTFYGLASKSDQNQMIQAMFAGKTGNEVAYIDHISSVSGFEGADKAYVKLYRTSYSGQQGEDTAPYLEFEGNVAIENGSLRIPAADTTEDELYYAVVFPANSAPVTSFEDYEKIWTKTYEAENASLLGKAKKASRTGVGDLGRSGKAEVENILDTTDGVSFQVNVPVDAKYKMQVYYSVAAPFVNAETLEPSANGQNRAIGQTEHHLLKVDGTEEAVLDYVSTVKTGYYNHADYVLDLSAGDHTITLTHAGENQSAVSANLRVIASLDKMDLTMADAAEESRVEAEEVIRKNPYQFAHAVASDHAGYAEGSGDFTFYVTVAESGLYSTKLIGTGKTELTLSKRKVNYAKTAASGEPVSTEFLKVGEADLDSDGKMSSIDFGLIYLTKGANCLKVSSAKKFGFDAIEFVKAAPSDTTTVVEAESAELSGNGKVIDNAYASGGKMTDGIGILSSAAEAENAGDDPMNSILTFHVKAKTAGDYVLTCYYTNDEPAPAMKKANGQTYVHPYNTDLVERFAQIAINGGAPSTVYFRNTYSWDTIKTMDVNVSLQAGDNTIRIYNDNSYHFSELVNSQAPRFDKFEITPVSVGSFNRVIKVTAIQLNQTALSLTVGEAKKLTATVAPANAANKTVTFKSSNPSVAAVDANGTVTAKAAGTAVITASAGDFSAQCKVTVTAKAASNPVTKVTKPGKVKISSAKNTAKKTITIKWKKVSGAKGYQIWYASSKNFKKNVKKVSVKKISTKLKKLKKKTTYYLKVRAYKLNGKTPVYGAFSKVVKVKVKK